MVGGLRRLIAVQAGIPLLLSLLVPLVVLGQQTADPTPVETAAPPAAQVVVVAVRAVPRSVTAYGVVHAPAEAVQSAKVLARVVALPLRAGDPVARGDLVALLDHADLDAQLAAAEAALTRADAALKEAESEYGRVKSLRAQGSATNRDMERATNGLSQARGARGEALAQVQLATARQGHARITAPFSGYFVERLVEVGEMATPGMPLVRVASAGAPELWADVPQSQVGRLKPGQVATVFVDGADDAFSGRVTRIVPAADPRSHTFTVKVVIDAAQNTERVYAGMFGRVEIPYANVPALVVPVSAIAHRAEVAGVYVARPDGDTPEFRLVRPGRRTGDFQVIESGLSRGEMVWADAAEAARQRASASAR